MKGRFAVAVAVFLVVLLADALFVAADSSNQNINNYFAGGVLVHNKAWQVGEVDGPSPPPDKLSAREMRKKNIDA